MSFPKSISVAFTKNIYSSWVFNVDHFFFILKRCINKKKFFICIFMPSSTKVYRLIFLIGHHIDLRNNGNNDIFTFMLILVLRGLLFLTLFRHWDTWWSGLSYTKQFFFFLKLLDLDLNILELLPLDLLLLFLNLFSYLFYVNSLPLCLI